MAEEQKPTAAADGKSKPVVRFALGVSFALTLATWLFFYYYRVTTLKPLSGPETTFVFAVWFAVAFVIRWLWVRRKQK